MPDSLTSRLFLAPMEGVVDCHLRKIYAELGGVDVCVTEFVRVTHTKLPEKVFKAACPELSNPLSTPVRIQLLGSNLEMMAYNAAKAAKMGAPAIDINFGCPAKVVNKHRGGACLLQDATTLFDIVAAVRQSVPASTPVTAKIRLGYNERVGYVENALAIQEAGAQELFVHARSKADGYKPPAYWPCIGEIKDALHIPVIANGEIWSLADFKQCRAETGCQDFMLGRGLLSKPDLANEIKAFLTHNNFTPLTWREIARKVYQLHEATLESYPKKYCGNRLKQWLMYLKRQYSEAEQLFEGIKTSRDPEVIRAAFQPFRDCA